MSPTSSGKPLRKYAFWATEEQLQGLKQVKARDGVLESEQIRRAIDAWLEAKGVTTEPPARKRKK
jgi:hypothetical protein